MPISKHLRIVIAGVLVFLVLALALALKDTAKPISASALENLIQKSMVVKVWIQGEYLYAQTRDAEVHKALLLQINPAVLKSIPIEKNSNKILAFSIAGTLLAFVLAYAFFYMRKMRGKSMLALTNRAGANVGSGNNGGVFGASNSSSPNGAANSIDSGDEFTPLESSLRFSDVAGISDAKDELLEILDFLKNPAKYQSLGVNMPKGVLLSGAPGVGKTMLAKALAGESGIPFFYQSGASFVEMFVGVGAKRVRALFNAAKRYAPCVIFIDEIDAIGKARGLGANNTERESTLNQLLIELDGFGDNSGIIVLGATNHIEALDPALLRSGRFDRKVFIELPNLKERAQIIELYLRKKPHALGEKIAQIAQKTSGFSGAMLATLVNEAALNAIRRSGWAGGLSASGTGAGGLGADILGAGAGVGAVAGNAGAPSVIIEEQDFEAVYQKIQSGKRRLPLLSPRMRQIYALYQASKILYALHASLPLQKASLFETDILEANAQTIGSKELGARLSFYLAGDRAVSAFVGERFGVFGEDFARLNALRDMAREVGLGDEAGGVANMVRNAGIERVESFVLSQRQNIIIIAAILCQDERVDIDSVQKTLQSVAQDSSQNKIQNKIIEAFINDCKAKALPNIIENLSALK